LRAAQRQLDTSAHNVANGLTPGFQRQRVEQTAQPTPGGVQTTVRQDSQPGTAGSFGHLAEDLVDQRMALYSFQANLKTVQTQDEMLGSLLDTRA
ncbi:MAG: flagellar basal body rod C-terminal domain-containing protein, partial [Hydrogenophaga sp.]